MKLQRRRAKRLLAGVLSGALAVSVSPGLGFGGIAGAASPLPAVADPIGAGNFCESAPTTEPFIDVSSSDPSIDEIICLVSTGLTSGTTTTTFSPNGPVSRRQMALFVKRMADLANLLEVPALNDLPAYDGTPDFSDVVGESAVFRAAIGQLDQANIVQGTSGTLFSPAASVTRRQMASFVNGLQGFLTGSPFTTSADFFSDDTGDSGEANLNALASVGIFQGDGAGHVFPGAQLSRRQMANILLRHAEVMFEAGDIIGGFAPANQTFPIGSAAAASAEFSGAAPHGDRGRRSYTVSGLDDTKTYDIAVFPAEHLAVSGGSLVFRDTEGTISTSDDNSIADWSATAARIETIDSVANADSNGNVLDVVPVGGDFTFTIDALAVDQVIPVVFFDADNGSLDGAPDLDLDAGDAPAEAFGSGGRQSWVAPLAVATSDGLDGLVVALDESANRFSIFSGGWAGDYDADTADVSYIYDSNDTFSLEGILVSLADFELALSRGDGIQVVGYSPSSSVVSTFAIVNPGSDTPTAPVPVTATAGTGTATNDITIVIDPDSPATPTMYDAFVIQRAPVIGGVIGTYATVKTLTPAEDTDTSTTTITWLDDNVPAGDYSYRVAGLIDGDQGPDTVAPNVTSS